MKDVSKHLAWKDKFDLKFSGKLVTKNTDEEPSVDYKISFHGDINCFGASLVEAFSRDPILYKAVRVAIDVFKGN